MNWEQIQGRWQEYKGKAKQRWGHLTDNDLTVINGKRDELAGKLLERKGATKAQVDKEIAEFEAACCAPEKSAKGAASGGFTKSASRPVDHLGELPVDH